LSCSLVSLVLISNAACILNVHLVLNTEGDHFLHVMLLIQLYWAENFEIVCELDFAQQEEYSYNIYNLDGPICFTQ
jgi:hypothetical protein